MSEHEATERSQGEQPRPSEVRARVLADHEKLRAGLDSIEHLGRLVRDGQTGGFPQLRQETERFLDGLAEHMRWEDVHLARALRDIDAWGAERERRLVEEHAQQRQRLADVLQRLRDPARPVDLVASDLLWLVQWLRDDMEGEERERLSEELLRDDVVATDMSSG